MNADIQLVNASKLNRTIFIRDNLEVLRCIDDKSVDLIYLDPPFNSNKNYGSPIGSKAAGFHFKDMWYLSDTDEAWWGELADKHKKLYSILRAIGLVNGDKDKAYLIYMAMRLIEIHRILKDTGSIYLHCDQNMSHSLKLIMDAIFGKKSFNNDISWRRGTGISRSSSKRFSRNHDCLLFFSKKDKRFFEKQYRPYQDKTLKMYKFNDNDGRGKYRLRDLRTYGKETIENFKRENKIVESKTGKLYLKQYLGKKPGIAMGDVWVDITGMGNEASKEKTSYSTQKPLKLIERIIKASCPENGIVLDPFCGCSTACIASEKLNRKWIGIDISPLAERLIKERMIKELGLTSQLVNIRKLLPVKNAPKVSRNIKNKLYGEQGGNCNGCQGHFEIRHLEIDHIVPRSKGGQDTDKNLQLLCGHCNRTKGNRTMAYLKAQLKAVS